MYSVKSAESLHKGLGGDFEFGTKIKSTYTGVHPTIWILALRSKLGAWQSHLCFRLENSEFDHLATMLASTKGLKDGKKTYCGPLGHRA